jgi:hypothetical protein
MNDLLTYWFGKHVVEDKGWSLAQHSLQSRSLAFVVVVVIVVVEAGVTKEFICRRRGCGKRGNCHCI